MSHSNCAFSMGKYTADATTVCSVCSMTGVDGDTYWFRGVLYTVCNDHNLADVLPVDTDNTRIVRLCTGICPDGSEKCIWPLNKYANADSIISEE